MTISHHLLAFLSLVILAGNILAEAAKCHPDNEAGLLGFKSGIQKNPSGLLETWIPGTDCCQYSPTGLRYLTGPFPEVFFKLPNLEYIYIMDSQLSGFLPADIENLTKLWSLQLEGNRFSGAVPSSIGKLTLLTQLDLGQNSFSGGLPSSLGNA
ncbi:hypothetical protein Droror1_Dr00000415 [Drosera rotundifolia]